MAPRPSVDPWFCGIGGLANSIRVSARKHHPDEALRHLRFRSCPPNSSIPVITFLSMPTVGILLTTRKPKAAEGFEHERCFGLLRRLTALQMAFTVLVLVAAWPTLHVGSLHDALRWSLVAPCFAGMLLTSMPLGTVLRSGRTTFCCRRGGAGRCSGGT